MGTGEGEVVPTSVELPLTYEPLAPWLFASPYHTSGEVAFRLFGVSRPPFFDSKYTRQICLVHFTAPPMAPGTFVGEPRPSQRLRAGGRGMVGNGESGATHEGSTEGVVGPPLHNALVLVGGL